MKLGNMLMTQFEKLWTWDECCIIDVFDRSCCASHLLSCDL